MKERVIEMILKVKLRHVTVSMDICFKKKSECFGLSSGVRLI